MISDRSGDARPSLEAPAAQGPAPGPETASDSAERVSSYGPAGNPLWKLLRARVREGTRTSPFPAALDALPERFLGRPRIHDERCDSQCQACLAACPSGALRRDGRGLVLDLGRCLFCRECVEACPHGAIEFTRDYRMATRRRSDLEMRSDEIALAESLGGELRGLLGRSLHLRAVSAGSCGGCETELQALTNVIFDVGRFGIQFVASPRHADGLIVVGGVSRNMRHALLETYHAMPQPAIVVAAGACAISGGPYGESGEVFGGVTDILPVDLFVPGCPPHPLTLLDGLLRLLGRL